MLMLDEGAGQRAHPSRRGDAAADRVRRRPPGACPPISPTPTAGRRSRRSSTAWYRACAAPPTLVRARDGHFMDKPDNVVSLINLATVRSLEEQWGFADRSAAVPRQHLHRRRARPGRSSTGSAATSGIGEAVFWVDRRNGRCGATNVDPATGRRDRDIPGSLRKAFGHKDLGVYLVARTDAAPGGRRRAASAPRRRRATRRRRRKQAAVPAGPRTFICRGCYFIYDEAQGSPAAGAAPGTRMADLPAGWRCPDCGSEKGMFRPHGADAGNR